MTEEKEQTVFMREAPTGPPKQSLSGDAVLLSIYPTGAGMGRRFALTGSEHIVGRLEGLDISLQVEGISRRHARICRDVTGWYVEDLGSTNGTQVNDVTLPRAQLKEGDLIRFGGAICKFLSGDNIEAQYHEEIYKLSIMDGLTQVHNKRYFIDFLERELRAVARQHSTLSLIMLDIDHFKKINDSLGHLAGDAVLKQLCARLRPRVRAADLLARYGGEEFAIILPATDRAGALGFAEIVRALVAGDPFTSGDDVIPCTISLGVAEVDPANPGTPDELIKRADDHLYEAKRSGRNRAVG